MTDKHQDLLFGALSLAAENVYVFKNDIDTNRSQWSNNAIDYFAFPKDYEEDVLPIWIARIHPDDREAYINEINQVFAGIKSNHHAQYRVRNKFGNYVWVECNGSIAKDETGTPKVFAGIVTRLDYQSKYDSLTKKLVIDQFYSDPDVNVPSHVLLFGMDSFRKVIHSYGYEAGNRMLCTLANILDQQLPNQRVYRMNGDEFLVIYPSTKKEDVRKYCNDVLKKFQKACEEANFTKNITFCCAADLVQPDKVNKLECMKRLELAMVQAKSLGPRHFVFFSGAIQEKYERLAKIEKELEYAINHNYAGFEVYYQPIVSAQTSEICTVEALLRFHSPKLGNISPEEFIPILENTRGIRRVGLWVMDQVMKQNAIWNKTYTKIRTGFNVSYLQLNNDTFIDQLLRTIEEYGVKKDNVIFELTESCKVSHPESLSNMFQRLINEGILVALDDFGMVNSSLTILREVPVTTVKIDHSFVRTITGDHSALEQANLAIVKGIFTMCNCMNLNVVVEGIETEQVAKIMTDMGAEYLQGYYFSKPLKAQDVEKKFTVKRKVKE